MGEEDFADFVAAIEEDERRRRTQRTNIFTEFSMEASGDTIRYIKPVYTESVDLSFDLKRKRKRCINI